MPALSPKGESKLNGYKTYVTAVGAVAAGIGMICTGFVHDPPDTSMMGQGVMMIFGALLAAFVRHGVAKGPQ